MVDFPRHIAFDPLGFRIHTLFVFIQEALRPLLRLRENAFGLLRRRVQFGIILFQLPVGFGTVPFRLIETVFDLLFPLFKNSKNAWKGILVE